MEKKWSCIAAHRSKVRKIRLRGGRAQQESRNCSIRALVSLRCSSSAGRSASKTDAATAVSAADTSPPSPSPPDPRPPEKYLRRRRSPWTELNCKERVKKIINADTAALNESNMEGIVHCLPANSEPLSAAPGSPDTPAPTARVHPPSLTHPFSPDRSLMLTSSRSCAVWHSSFRTSEGESNLHRKSNSPCSDKIKPFASTEKGESKCRAL